MVVHNRFQGNSWSAVHSTTNKNWLHITYIIQAYNKNCIVATIFSLFQLLFLHFSLFHILSLTPNSPCGFQTATHEMRLCTNGSETQWRHLIRNTGGFTSLTSWGSETLRMSSRLRLVSKVLRKVQGKVENSSLENVLNYSVSFIFDK